MPNRILRDWTDSDKIETLSCEAERFFTRLIMKADDFGCYYACPKRLRVQLFPIKEAMTVKIIMESLSECVKARLVRLYESGGSNFIEIVNFHQRMRAMHRRFPEPSATDDGHVTVMDSPKTEKESLEGKNQLCLTDDGHVTVILPDATASITELDIYEHYPLKVAKPVALAAIRKAMSRVSPEFLLERTKELARIRNGNKNHLAHPATWFNQERYNDDPNTWKTGMDEAQPQSPITAVESLVASRIGKIFARSTEQWDANEIRAFRAIGTITEAGLSAVEKYHAAKFPSAVPDYRCRSLLSLLNKWNQEADCAKKFKPHSAL
jgi:hypothetical protein